MMKSPEVTIVIPVYNGARYLGETIHSFLSQSFKNFELLAIDDGSTDASSDIVRSFKGDRVRLIRQKNSGLVYTLNRGIEEARAPYIARSDQDDISFPDRLERQINDPYVRAAKAEGYRSRAAYKLIEMNEKYRFLKRGMTIVDLGAAPGGWTQIAVDRVGDKARWQRAGGHRLRQGVVKPREGR